MKLVKEDIARVEEFNNKMATYSSLLIKLVAERAVTKATLKKQDEEFDRLEGIIRYMHEDERLLAQELSSKYGEGTLDTETGEFTKTNPPISKV